MLHLLQLLLSPLYILRLKSVFPVLIGASLFSVHLVLPWAAASRYVGVCTFSPNSNSHMCTWRSRNVSLENHALIMSNSFLV